MRSESFDGLFGQAVDQVDVDRAKVCGAAVVDDAQRFLDALDPVHGALDCRVEILHAEARAVESEAGIVRDVRCRDVSRIELDGEIALCARAQAEVMAQARHQLAELDRAHEVRRAAAEVNLHDLAIAIEQCAEHLDLALEALQVWTRSGEIARDDAVAAAVEARAEAVGNVYVQRQSARSRPGIALPDMRAKHCLGELRPELRRGRIRGVARARPVVAA